MTETTVKISGMMCGMCEAHICDVIRARFAVRKVTASHSKGQAVILSESGLAEAALRQAIAETGYEVTAVSARPAEEKKGLFGFLKRCSPDKKNAPSAIGRRSVFHLSSRFTGRMYLKYCPGLK